MKNEARVIVMDNQWTQYLDVVAAIVTRTNKSNKRTKPPRRAAAMARCQPGKARGSQCERRPCE
eukprot:CAMPEP_0176207208 /NCGR_PEP_ID=MMETSP0121_2-20121125/12498_1 /TAXON_ID=160619 /ORGANISM="Kryptoperidinium foliaceum, Strain CCMP 1326" /LENGTH=63 /DNA_ID=CAMNT_0017546179 /DNA_START=247 /DNA_END=435 /DNA_ORIENTATION=+